jgi:hypothetical protein
VRVEIVVKSIDRRGVDPDAGDSRYPADAVAILTVAILTVAILSVFTLACRSPRVPGNIYALVPHQPS